MSSHDRAGFLDFVHGTCFCSIAYCLGLGFLLNSENIGFACFLGSRSATSGSVGSGNGSVGMSFVFLRLAGGFSEDGMGFLFLCLGGFEDSLFLRLPFPDCLRCEFSFLRFLGLGIRSRSGIGTCIPNACKHLAQIQTSYPRQCKVWNPDFDASDLSNLMFCHSCSSGVGMVHCIKKE